MLNSLKTVFCFRISMGSFNVCCKKKKKKNNGPKDEFNEPKKKETTTTATTNRIHYVNKSCQLPKHSISITT